MAELAQLKNYKRAGTDPDTEKEQRFMWDQDTGTGTYKNYYVDPDL
jgi:hypothetical protein